MNVVITQQDYDAFEKSPFADFRVKAPFDGATRPPNPGDTSTFLNKEINAMLQIDYVRVFEDRISPYPELVDWLKRQCSKAFSYEETVLQCVFAMEYERMGCWYRANARFVWRVLVAETCRFGSEGVVLRVPSYGTFLKRVRALRDTMPSASSLI
ncbi:hypothetical protein G6K83_07675 [Agrobacterium rhizogenes]|uniref:hypothetical protein n=1 Tax=Rhizobium rhizogenes TaxID=359 RepID=UPI001572980A|nr:hypothetical protein [Rhizobium rhizogenes]NTH24954.1 hypothetical protein [Rhizobium rhizogenes]